ncbi:hypothetical protein C6A85_000000112310 [Mycobacterium sp. ITM-2017-0098]|nr:hypothetical protein C6A85_000000112310 [Mycobacterium sp. ITM-2017-0098]
MTLLRRLSDLWHFLRGDLAGRLLGGHRIGGCRQWLSRRWRRGRRGGGNRLARILCSLGVAGDDGVVSLPSRDDGVVCLLAIRVPFRVRLVRLFKVRLFKVRLFKVRLGQVGLGEVGNPTARTA